MTIAEFQAWLDGYSASFGDAPNAEQWAKIKGKIATLAVVAVPSSAYNGISGGPIGAPATAAQVYTLRPEQMPSQSHTVKGGTCASPLALR
jgi:hypothetical protein